MHEYEQAKHHTEREMAYREQTRGGPLGLLHKNQEGRYQDELQTTTTAREKYYGERGTFGAHHADAAHPATGTAAPGTHPTVEPTPGTTGTQETYTHPAHTYPAGATPIAGATGTTESEGHHSHGVLSRLLHRDHPTKLEKEAPK